jgi:hypothetical protein
MQRSMLSILILAATLLTTASAASAQGYPFCGAGKSPGFVFGFASLSAQLGSAMGVPIECEHPNNVNGDTLQKTSTGLAYWRKSTNTPTFTDGYRHWAITAAGLISWLGDSPDPPTLASVPPRTLAPPVPSPAPQPRSLESFVRMIAGQVDQFWKDTFVAINTPYVSPRLQWVPQGQRPPACGGSVSAGPGYCPLNRTVALPAVFFDRVWRQDADAAVVVVIAHEWGHHMQQSLGIMNGMYFTIQIELQADCLAGLFFNYANTRGWLDRGDLDEALAMSWSGGDPILVPWFDEAAHGSSQQRVFAFRRGFQGNESCGIYTA